MHYSSNLVKVEWSDRPGVGRIAMSWCSSLEMTGVIRSCDLTPWCTATSQKNSHNTNEEGVSEMEEKGLSLDLKSESECENLRVTFSH